ncbi:MAG: sensor histidine kinase [Thermodesulfobacteriota bacterium]
MSFTIRTKLTLWYTILLTISILAFGVIFSLTLSRIIISGVDTKITSVAEILATTVLRPPRTLTLPEHFDIIFEQFFGIKTAGNYIQVLKPNGTVEAKSSTLEGLFLPLTETSHWNAVHGRATYEITEKVGDVPIRVVTYPIMSGDSLVNILQVGASMEGREEILHGTLYIFIFGGPVAVLIAGIIGWFLTGKTLRPVANITQMARKIGAESLNERLETPGPRDEIGRLAETFNEMIARLEGSFNRTRQFTADASHELKTPLTIMKGEVEVALKGEKGEERLKEVLVSVLEEIDRMSYIVTNLLDLARVDQDRGEAVKEGVKLDHIVSERFELAVRLAAEKGVGLEVTTNRPATVSGDPVRLGQVVFNLIDNAIKYTQKGGRVTISLETDTDCAVMRVSDTGVGIGQEDIPYLFDRFYRVDKARTREAGGAGLGLSICKEIVDAHGGRIEVESEPGVGSTFTVYLPIEKSA